MSLSRMAVVRPVLTTVLITVFLVLGIFSYMRLVIDLFPQIEFPFVTVTTIYPGAGPEEVESQVTEKLEDAVATLADIRRLDSINREGLSLLLIEFELGVDVDLAAIDVKEKVEGVLTELPVAVERPQVLKFDINAIPIMSLALTGSQSPRELYEIADRRVRDELSRASGVASVSIVGGLKREIQVALDPARLTAYGLDATQVSRAIAQENVSIPAGRITRPEQELTVRALGEFARLDELRRLPVALQGGGRTVRIQDLGRVIDGSEEMRDMALANGRNSVGLFIQKRTDANTVETAAAVSRRVAQLNEILPQGVSLEIIRDRSTFIRRAVRDVIINIFLGIFLTTVILYLFLHSMRSTVVAAVAMPTSIIATFLLIDFAGFTVNVMTLLALGVSIGVLVANAIVVLENISRRIDTEGEDSVTAARKGTDQVAVAVAATALTNIVVFTPIAFMGGIIGQFFVQFGLTVVFATLFSLLVSFTLTPMLASRLLRPKEDPSTKPGFRRLLAGLEAPLLALARIWDRGYRKVEERYGSSLQWSIRYRVRTVAIVTAIFIGSLLLFRFVGGEFLPQSDQGFVQILLELPAGSTLEQTREVLNEAGEIIRREVPETEAMLMTIGGENKSVEDGEIILRLSDADERERGIVRIMNELRPHLAGIPAADITVQIGGGFGDEKDIVVEVLGPDLDVIRSLADSIRAEMAQIPGLVDLAVSAEPGKPEVVFRPDREEMADRLLSMASVGGELRGLYEGVEASLYREGGEEYTIRVRLEEEERRDTGSLARVRVSTHEGQVPLTALGRLDQRRGLAEITRKNKERMVSITANVGTGTLVEKVNAIQRRVAEMDIPREYHVEYAGQFERLGESFTEIFKALILAVILTYLVLAAILESFVHPFTILFTLPLGLVGVIMALFFTGVTINIISLMAVVMLVGIVVNNAILILDYAKRRREEGLSAKEAILEAGPARLRPVLMTTLAVLAGMLPQALGGAGAAFTTAMALVTIGGVLAAGVLSLFLIPVLYTVFDRFTTAGRRVKGS